MVAVGSLYDFQTGNRPEKDPFKILGSGSGSGSRSPRKYVMILKIRNSNKYVRVYTGTGTINMGREILGLNEK